MSNTLLELNQTPAGSGGRSWSREAWTGPLCYKYSCFKKHRIFHQPPDQVIAHILPPGRELISWDLKFTSQRLQDDTETLELEPLKDSSSSELGEGVMAGQGCCLPNTTHKQHNRKPNGASTPASETHHGWAWKRWPSTQIQWCTQHPKGLPCGRRRISKCFAHTGNIPNPINLGEKLGASVTAFFPPPNTRSTVACWNA